MNLRKAIILGALMLSLVSFSGCKKENKNAGKTKVIFELEGGTYKNCTAPITYYYDLDDKGYILEPTSITEKEVERSGYEFSGWYKTKKVNGNDVTYEDEWNFEKDKIDKNGVTLYAYWKKIYKHSFNVCYYDENNQLQVLGTYENIKPGEKFLDRQNYAKRFGYTALGYFDEEGNEITSLTHPGGDQSTAVNVIVKYVKGIFKVVRSASELKVATSDNIYLLNDIDLGGDTINFGNYKKTLIGNGHTISNFSVKYDPSKGALKDDLTETGKKSLYISLFGNTDGAHIENVTFKDVKVVVKTSLKKYTNKIYVSPLCITSSNSSFQNVSFSGSFDYEELPDDFFNVVGEGEDKQEILIDGKLIYVMDRAYYNKDDKSTFENVTIDVVNLKEN